MDFSKNYYRILGLKQSATQDDIKKAYRSLALKYHPDKNEGNTAAAEMFQRAKEAYEILADPGKKRQYDAVFKNNISSAYSFAKQVAYANEENPTVITNKPSDKHPGWAWLKPVVFIIIAMVGVWLIMHSKH